MINTILLIFGGLTILIVTFYSLWTIYSTRNKYYKIFIERENEEASKYDQKNNKKLRSFIYLDEYKMFSISSQILEGLTESVVQFNTKNISKIEEQKGPISSGKVLADIISSSFDEKEKRILHDYSFSLFEKELKNLDKILNLDEDNIDNISMISNYNFININSDIYFNDIQSIVKTLEIFNQFGESLTYVTNFENLKDLIRRKGSLEKIAQEMGLKMDAKFLKSLINVLEYGYGEHFEIQAEISSYKFSAILQPDYLKEAKELIIKKYSRQSEVKFNILGLVTQHSNTYDLPSEEDLEGVNQTDPQYSHIKEAIKNLTDHLMNVENTFTGRQPNEIIIEPIAIYRDL